MNSTIVNASSSSDDSIKVLVRIRPPDSAFPHASSIPPATPRKTAARDSAAFEVEGNTIAEPKAGLHFTFDHVAKQNAAQVERRWASDDRGI